MVDLETGSKTLVTQNGGFRPVWGPDGETLYYSLGCELKVVDVNITDGFRVLGQPRTAVVIGEDFCFDVSDKGHIVVARRMANPSSLVDVILNWSSTLEKP